MTRVAPTLPSGASFAGTVVPDMTGLDARIVDRLEPSEKRSLHWLSVATASASLAAGGAAASLGVFALQSPLVGAAFGAAMGAFVLNLHRIGTASAGLPLWEPRDVVAKWRPGTAPIAVAMLLGALLAQVPAAWIVPSETEVGGARRDAVTRYGVLVAAPYDARITAIDAQLGPADAVGPVAEGDAKEAADTVPATSNDGTQAAAASRPGTTPVTETPPVAGTSTGAADASSSAPVPVGPRGDAPSAVANPAAGNTAVAANDVGGAASPVGDNAVATTSPISDAERASLRKQRSSLEAERDAALHESLPRYEEEVAHLPFTAARVELAWEHGGTTGLVSVLLALLVAWPALLRTLRPGALRAYERERHAEERDLVEAAHADAQHDAVRLLGGHATFGRRQLAVRFSDPVFRREELLLGMFPGTVFADSDPLRLTSHIRGLDIDGRLAAYESGTGDAPSPDPVKPEVS